jgi:hypothetical protein
MEDFNDLQSQSDTWNGYASLAKRYGRYKRVGLITRVPCASHRKYNEKERKRSLRSRKQGEGYTKQSDMDVDAEIGTALAQRASRGKREARQPRHRRPSGARGTRQAPSLHPPSSACHLLLGILLL